MLDVNLHRQVLLDILKDIYGNKKIAPFLGFKGGTCMYFFHELDRFSTDLDFNLLCPLNEFDDETLKSLLEKYIDLHEARDKKYTLFFMGSYKKTYHKVKVEISKRSFCDTYEIRSLYGLSVKCLTTPYLFAHKLCAITERKKMVNRDLYDTHFMLSKHFPIADEIVKERTGLNTKEYFKKLIDFIPSHVSEHGILYQLGEVLSESKKDWVRRNLINELLFYLRSQSE